MKFVKATVRMIDEKRLRDGAGPKGTGHGTDVTNSTFVRDGSDEMRAKGVEALRC